MDRSKFIWVSCASLAFFIVGILIGRYGTGRNGDDDVDTPQHAMMSAMIMDEISPSKIGENLKYLSSVPHLAGTPQDLEFASWVRDRFVESGLDEVKLVPYKVLLSYPDKENPNRVFLLDSNGRVNFTTSGRSSPLHSSEEFSPLVQPNFNAYSPSGTVQGELVYANYGRKEDFELLKSLGIDVRGRIVIARYGLIFRGNIVNLAEVNGAIGVVLFSDPKDFAPEGRNSVYPNTTRLPGMAVQSGSILLGYGDPLTPLYPAIDSAYRLPEAEAPLPKIPVQPIGYDEAEVLLRSMPTDNPAPADWQGGLNTTYYLGGNSAQKQWSVRLEVRMTNKLVTAYNTIGTLYGREEPDRYVLIGNHMDAWILGAMDPASGTSVLVELARAFGHFKRTTNWRPRRTLIFCGWGAEEYGMIGSYEWAEQNAKILSQRAVAYINVDIAMEGNYTLKSQSVPSLYSVIREAAKMVPNPNPLEVAAGRKTVFDTWLHANPDINNKTQPSIGNLGSGSDYTVFSHVLGVPSVDLYYDYQEKIGSYPLYHTLYETYHAVADLMDPGFHYHRAIARIMAQMALSLSESVILPFDGISYANFLARDFSQIEQRYNEILTKNGGTFEYFKKAVAHFRNATEFFSHTVLPRVDTANPLAVRKINDQLMQLERGFIDPHGLPDRLEFNHIVFAPSSVDKYSSDRFAGLVDLFKIVGNKTEIEEPKLWQKIKQHLAAIAYLIDAAADSLNESI